MECHRVVLVMLACGVACIAEQEHRAQGTQLFYSGIKPICSAHRWGAVPLFLSYWTVSQPALCFGGCVCVCVFLSSKVVGCTDFSENIVDFPGSSKG